MSSRNDKKIILFGIKYEYSFQQKKEIIDMLKKFKITPYQGNILKQGLINLLDVKYS